MNIKPRTRLKTKRKDVYIFIKILMFQLKNSKILSKFIHLPI